MELKDSEKRLLQAVSTIIEEEGFNKIGINKIARTAGCDKVLIYRYFGGLEGLIIEWAKQHDFYIQAYDSFIDKIENTDKTNLKETTKEILLAQLHFTRQNKILQELLLWELSGDLKFRPVRKLREANGYKLQTTLEHILDGKEKNINIYVTILITSISYLVLSTLTYPLFNGIDFSEEDAWQKFENVLCDYIDMLFEKVNK